MTSPDPQASHLSDRLGMLSDQHPWMEPQVAYSLASSPHPTNTILDMAESFRSSLATARTGFTDLYSDPVLQKTPTVHLAVARYLNSTLGTWPIADEHLVDVQKNLQRMGYGKDLPITGGWDQRWNSVWNQAGQVETSKQLAGDKTGSISTAHAAHSFLLGALPKHAFNAVVGFVKSIPGDVRDVVADSVGVGGFIAHGVEGIATHPLAHGDQGRAMIEADRNAGRAAALGVQHALGSDMTAEQMRQSTTGAAIGGKLIADIGTVFLAHGVVKAGTAVARAAGEALTRNGELTLAQAMSGPGVVSNLLRPGAQELRGPGSIARTVFGGRTAEEVGRDAARAGMVNSRVVQHIPILGRMGPVVGRAADADGLYYKTRTVLASPYRVPAIKTGGIAATQGVGLGIKTRVTAAASSKLTGPDDRTNLAAGVQDEHVMDHVDDSIRNATSGLTGHHFSVGIDDLMWVLPGVNAGAHAAEHGEQALNRINDRLGHVGALGALQRATGAKTVDELEQMAGSRENLTVWLRDKLMQAGADFHAENNLIRRDDLPEGADRTIELQNLGHEALHDDGLLREGVQGTLAGGAHDFEMRLRTQIANSETHADKWLKQDLSHWLNARNIVADRILGVPEHAKLLITPQSTHALAEAHSNAAFDAATDISGKGPGKAPSLTSAWLSGNNPDLIPGSVGTARLTTLTKQPALKAIDQFTARLAQIRTIPNAIEQAAAESDLVKEMAVFGEQTFRLNSHQLQGLFGAPRVKDAEGLAAVLEHHAEQLSTEVHIPADAPAALHRAVKDLADGGYKLVHGTDIGHIFRNDLPPMDVMTGAITRRRKIVSRLGLNPERFTDTQVGHAAGIDVLTEIQKVMDRAKPGTFPPGYNAHSIVRDLRDRELITPGEHEIGGLRGAAWGMSTKNRRRAVEFAHSQNPEKPIADIERELKAEVLGYFNIRDLPEKKLIEVLTRTDNVPWTTEVAMRGADATHEVPTALMSDDAARMIAKAIRSGYAKRPGYMIGAGRIEDIMRTGIGPLGKVPVLRDTTMMHRLDSMPNRYVQLRNIYRFSLSPMFTARRVVKTNFKAGLEGIPWTANPLKDMQAKGDAETAFKLIDRIYPEHKLNNAYMDEAERQLRQQDILGLFNNRHYEARAALEWQRQGKTDEQIRGLIQKTFHYGGTAAEGRTAAERTANVVFFPYSFSKTLYRNVGSYLMDEPAQALLIAAGLEHYRDWSFNHESSPLSQKWLDEHLPVLKEMERLNAFSHGISPGELGGINAPLIKGVAAPAAKAVLNFFMPQKWQVHPDIGKSIQRSVPVYHDWVRVQKELSEQGRITAAALGNSLGAGMDRVTNTHRALLDPRAPALTGRAQQAHARALVLDLEDAYKTVLDYNAAHQGSVEDQYTFPDDESLPMSLRNKPISRGAMKDIAQRFYPAYDPSKGADFAIKRQQAIKDFLDANPNADYQQFTKLASQVEAYKNRDSYDAEQLAAITAQMRHAAVTFGSKDAKFRQFYKDNYVGTFGPLEKLRATFGKAH